MSQKSITSFFGGGKGGSASGPSSAKSKGKENKAAAIEAKRLEALAKLKRKHPEAAAAVSMDLEGYFPRDAEDSTNGWHAILKSEFQKPYFRALDKFLTSQYKSKTVYPPEHQIFEAFRLCPMSNIKVVIIGQDPYHGRGQGHGVCFSVQHGVRPPPSLKNIFKELHNDVGVPIPTHGYLKPWADQGVLLLNTVLTVVGGQANSHRKRGWETFTDAVIRKINAQCENVVFLCWGKPAQKKAEMVSKTKHHILMSSHPSPLGATKTSSPFIGSRCFSKVNELLRKAKKEEIDWKL